MDNINALIYREKKAMDISDDEWFSDEDEDFEEMSTSRQFLTSLSQFASVEFLKKFVLVAFPDNSDVAEINVNLIALCRLGVLLNALSTRDNTFFNMLNHLAFNFRIVPKMWRTVVESKYVESFRPQNIHGVYCGLIP